MVYSPDNIKQTTHTSWYKYILSLEESSLQLHVFADWEFYTEMLRKPHNLKAIELFEPPVEPVLSALSRQVEELRIKEPGMVYPSPDIIVVWCHLW